MNQDQWTMSARIIKTKERFMCQCAPEKMVFRLKKFPQYFETTLRDVWLDWKGQVVGELEHGMEEQERGTASWWEEDNDVMWSEVENPNFLSWMVRTEEWGYNRQFFYLCSFRRGTLGITKNSLKPFSASRITICENHLPPCFSPIVLLGSKSTFRKSSKQIQSCDLSFKSSFRLNLAFETCSQTGT